MKLMRTQGKHVLTTDQDSSPCMNSDIICKYIQILAYRKFYFHFLCKNTGKLKLFTIKSFCDLKVLGQNHWPAWLSAYLSFKPNQLDETNVFSLIASHPRCSWAHLAFSSYQTMIQELVVFDLNMHIIITFYFFSKWNIWSVMVS